MFENRMSRPLPFSPWPLALFGAAVIMAMGLFAVTQSVHQREQRIETINRQLLSEQQTARVLEAEWAYLSRPDRLEELMAMKSTAGVSPAAGEPMEMDVMPPTPTPIAPIMAAAPEPEVVAEEEAPKKSEPKVVKKTAEKKKSVTPVKKASAKTPAKKTMKTAKVTPKKTTTKTVDVWPIKKAKPAQRTNTVAYRAPMPVRGGVARPIVE